MIVIPKDRIKEMKSKGWWGDQTLDDLFRKHVGAHPDAEALVDPLNAADVVGGQPDRLTWRETAHAVDRLAAVLVAHGITKDKVVVIQLPNIAELSIAYLACLRLGVIASPAPVQYRENELAYIIDRTDAVAAITADRIGKHQHGQMIVALKTRCPTLKTVFVLGETCPAGALDLEPLMDGVTGKQHRAAQKAARVPALASEASSSSGSSPARMATMIAVKIVTTAKAIEIGRVKNGARLPSERTRPRRRLLSSSGPRTRPRTKGAIW